MSAAATLSALGIRLANAVDGQHTAACPRCSHTRAKSDAPCLSVKVDGAAVVFNCHHCGWKGAADSEAPATMAAAMAAGTAGGRLRSVMAMTATLNGAPPPAPPQPREPEFLDPPEIDEAPLTEAAVEWLAARGLPLAAVAPFRLTSHWRTMPRIGWTETLVLPCFDRGALVGRKYRALAAKSFTQDPKTRRAPFNADAVRAAAAKGGPVVLVEGEFDAISCGAVDVAAASLPDGAGKGGNAKRIAALSASGLLDSGAPVVLAGDADEPGRALTRAIARAVTERGGRAAGIDWATFDCKDANDALLRHGPDALRGILRAAAEVAGGRA